MKFNLSNIKEFKKEHKFLFIAIVISWLLGLLLFIGNIDYYIRISYRYKSYDYFKLFFQYILPPVTVSLISYIACKTMSKYPKLSKWISAILNIFLIWQLLSIILMGIILAAGWILGALFIEPN